MSAAGQGFAPYDNQEIERAGSRNNERSSFFLVPGRPFFSLSLSFSFSWQVHFLIQFVLLSPFSLLKEECIL